MLQRILDFTQDVYNHSKCYVFFAWTEISLQLYWAKKKWEKISGNTIKNTKKRKTLKKRQTFVQFAGFHSSTKILHQLTRTLRGCVSPRFPLLETPNLDRPTIGFKMS